MNDHVTDSTAHFAPSRRGVLRAAAWTVPAVTVAATAPAYANSVSPLNPCPVASGQVGWSVSLAFSGLDLSNAWRWYSSGTFTFRIGTSSGATTYAGVQYTSDTPGLVAHVSDDEYTVTTPYAVQWASAPVGWTIARVEGNTWRFRRTDASTVKTGVVATPASRQVVNGQTGTIVPASPTFTATILASGMTNGQRIPRTSQVPVGAKVTRHITNTQRPECNTTPGVAQVSSTMTATAAGVSTMAMRSAPAPTAAAEDETTSLHLVGSTVAPL